jgi:hypothetical protein
MMNKTPMRGVADPVTLAFVLSLLGLATALTLDSGYQNVAQPTDVEVERTIEPGNAN